jgi:hypothetical protein
MRGTYKLAVGIGVTDPKRIYSTHPRKNLALLIDFNNGEQLDQHRYKRAMRNVSYLYFFYELLSINNVTRECLSSSRVPFNKEMQCRFRNVSDASLQ